MLETLSNPIMHLSVTVQVTDGPGCPCGCYKDIVVVYHVTIVAVGHGLLKKNLLIGNPRYTMVLQYFSLSTKGSLKGRPDY